MYKPLLTSTILGSHLKEDKRSDNGLGNNSAGEGENR